MNRGEGLEEGEFKMPIDGCISTKLLSKLSQYIVHYFVLILPFPQNWHKTINLNKAVLRSGFAKVTDLPELSNRRLSVKLTQELLKAELAAEKSTHGSMV